MRKRMNRRKPGTKTLSGLYAVTPDCNDTADLLRRSRLALQGGARALQYRNKTADAALRLAQATALRALTREFGATFIVNDEAQLAAQIEADGVHLGTEDDDIATARKTLGGDKIIGISCYNRLSRAEDAARAGADYVAFGAFFPSNVKPGAVRADVGLLREARAALTVPLVAIGGITVKNGALLIGAGADALAVISALFAASDITAAAQQFGNLFIHQNLRNHEP
jgi:thiamine-phosphate pyrophosphorylase